jgi:hypothetical protein
MFSMKKNQRLMAGLLSPVVPCSPVLKGQLSPVIAYSPIMKGQLSPVITYSPIMKGQLSTVLAYSPIMKGQLSPVIAYSPIMKGQLSPSPPPAPKKGESGVFGKSKRSSAPQHVAMRLQDSIELYKRLYGKRSGIPRYQEPIGQCEPIKRKRFGGFFMSKLKKMFVKLCKTGKENSVKITREEVMENEFMKDNNYSKYLYIYCDKRKYI